MKIENAVKGGFYLTLNAVRIHSSYDPQKEAFRFVSRAIEDEWGGATKINTVILIGPGLGYLSQSLSQLVEYQRLFIFFLKEESRLFFKKEFSDSEGRIVCWDPKMGEARLSNILSSIGELDLGGVKLLSWPPMIKALPEIAERVQSLVVEYLRRLSGNIHTTGGFGKKWALNSFRNFIQLSHYSPLPSLTENPSGILIVASGKYLESALPIIAEYASRFLIVALPSALLALNEASIKPDLIFTTDPGYYASLHYRSWSRDIPLAVPLTGYSSSLLSSSDFKDSNIVLFGQNSFFEKAIDGAFPLSLPIVPECGTVAGTALRWASANSLSPLCFAGLDFCFSDIHSHISPHPYETYLGINEYRGRPNISTLYSRALSQAPQILSYEGDMAIRGGSSLNIYKDWTRDFIESSSMKSKKIYRINPSPVDIGALELPLNKIKDYFPLKTPLSFSRLELPSLLEKREILNSLIKRWSSDLVNFRPEDIVSSKINNTPFFYIETAKLMKIKRDFEQGGETTALVDEFKISAEEFLKRLERICG